jgi:succinate semialdehyde reductase
MYQIKQPPTIIIGNNSCKNFKFKNKCLIITSPGTKNRRWLDHLDISNYYLFDKVEPNPSMETVIKIINQFSKMEIADVVGIGGGSSLDVAKYVAYKLKKKKILIPTTFGSGSEVTKISVLKVNGKKQRIQPQQLIFLIIQFFIQDLKN